MLISSAEAVKHCFCGVANNVIVKCFQPLTEIAVKKCKRCGFYEKDSIKSDDVFDEWEFCLSDFIASDGKYIHFKNKEFNATFLCPECIPLQKG
ncbi:hypothetical protein CK203_024030 [Vitis vinifera]|uniref:DUF7953 domain-containing protein n=1 Tax=Vitis vinifera TaxID=29760 RepID=A0A438IQ04_VITVI|nr:hypothetical protein CK203_024030 [Vitis vinifera]